MKSIWNLTLKQFYKHAAQSRPKVTGGCTLLAAANFGTALVLLALEVSKIKLKSKKDKKVILDRIIELNQFVDRMRAAADEDLRIFDHYRSLKRKKNADENEITSALVEATASPLKAGDLIRRCADLARECARYCHENVKSDLDTGILLLDSCNKGMLVLAKQNNEKLPSAKKAVIHT
jgi:formiminotetrahydrofolate cyclodeaminase